MALETPEPKEGNALKRYGPLAVIVLVAQVTLAWLVIEFAFKTRVNTGLEEDLTREYAMEFGEKKADTKGGLPFYYTSEDLENIIANPAGTNAERFVMFDIQLGLVAHDRSKKPPKDDITKKVAADGKTLEKLGKHTTKIKSIILKVIRMKTVDQLSGDSLHEVEEEIRKRLNEEVFKVIFPITKDSQKEIQVQEVGFTGIVIQ